MDAGRAGLAGDARFRFARRLITRPAMAGAEDHDSCDEATFREAEAKGALALSWRAHGLSYGIPAAELAGIAESAVVIVNISRAVIAAAEPGEVGDEDADDERGFEAFTQADEEGGEQRDSQDGTDGSALRCTAALLRVPAQMVRRKVSLTFEGTGRPAGLSIPARAPGLTERPGRLNPAQQRGRMPQPPPTLTP